MAMLDFSILHKEKNYHFLSYQIQRIKGIIQYLKDLVVI